LAGRLERLAGELAGPPVRLVKLIGDAAMLVAPEPMPLVVATRDLVAAAAADDRLPRLRAGVAAGQALNRSGDWYGHPVNLASRLTAAAEPDTVLATEPVAAATGDVLTWSPMGTRRLSAPWRRRLDAGEEDCVQPSSQPQVVGLRREAPRLTG
jgi:adenylate cyclase